MASKQEVQLFNSLLDRGIDANKAKEVILKARKQGVVDEANQNLGGGVVKSDATVETGAGQVNQTQDIPDIQIKQPKAGTLASLGQSLEKRGTNILENIKQAGEPTKITAKPFSLEALKQSAVAGAKPIREGAQIVGDVFGGAGDIIGEGLIGGLKALGKGASAITPDFIEEPIKQQVGELGASILQSETGQSGLKALQEGAKAWGEFKKTNPETSKTLESIGNILSFTPIGRLGKTGTETVGGAIETTGKQITKSGEKKIAKKLNDVVEDLILTPNSKKQAILQEEAGKISPGGIFKKGEIKADKLEQSIINEVKRVPGIKAGDPIRKINQGIIAEKSKQGAELEKLLLLKGSNFTKLELKHKMDKLIKQVSNEPLLKGDPEKGAEQIMKTLQGFLDDTEMTSIGLLRARKKFDKFIDASGFNPYNGVETPLKFAARKLRSGLNDIIDEMSPNVDVKKLLKSQSDLFIAIEKIAPKAIKEAKSSLGRLIQKIDKAINIRNIAIGASVITGGSISGGLSIIAGVAGGILGLAATGKLIFNPKLRKGIGKIIKALGVAIKKTPGNPDLQVLKQELQDFLDNSEVGEDNKNKTNLPINK